MEHQHLTWPRILWMVYHSERAGLWQLEAPLVALEACEGCREACPGLWEMAQAGEFSERMDFFELALKRSRWLAEATWESLKFLAPELLRQALKRRPATYGLVDILVEESYRQASLDRDHALILAESALEMARRLPVLDPEADAEVDFLPDEALDGAVRAEMLALAHAVLGNALRVADCPWEAEEEFQQALTFLEEVEQDARCELHGRARVLAMQASLLTDTRRLEEAIECLEEAQEAIARDPRSPAELVVDVGIKSSIALGLAHRDKEALTVLDGVARECSGAELPAALEFALIHRLAEQSLWSGDFKTAREFFPRIKQLCPGRTTLDALRVDWLEARIVAAEGDALAALERLTHTQEAFLAEDAVHEAALLSLEIAAVLHALGRRKETVEHAQRAVLLFVPLGLDQETLCALALTADSARRGRLTLELTEILLRYARGGVLPEQALWM